MFDRILVCLDGSSLAEQVLPCATEMAERFGSKMILLRVIDLSGYIYLPGVVVFKPLLTSRNQRDEREAREYLERVALPLQEKGLEIASVVLQGLPGEFIVRYARENEIDLIAFTTRSDKKRRREDFGSVADFVLRSSNLPVLTVRPQQDRA